MKMWHVSSLHKILNIFRRLQKSFCHWTFCFQHSLSASSLRITPLCWINALAKDITFLVLILYNVLKVNLVKYFVGPGWVCFRYWCQMSLMYFALSGVSKISTKELRHQEKFFQIKLIGIEKGIIKYLILKGVLSKCSGHWCAKFLFIESENFGYMLMF